MGPPRHGMRVGATSYVYPGTLVHNAERLAGQVQDMEIVLWVTPEGVDNYPSAVEVAQLARIGRESGLTYTVHLPRDLGAANDDGALRLARRAVELCAPLNPYAYVMHIDTADAGSEAWRARALAALTQVVEWVGDPEWVALENLESYPPAQLHPLFAALPIARTLDIGHLWKAGLDPLPVIDEWRDATRVVHLHGVRTRGGVVEDHGTLAWMEPARVAAVLARLHGWQGVLTLEVFEQDYFSSRSALDAALRPPGGAKPDGVHF